MDKASKIRELLCNITGTDKPTFDFRLMEVVAVEGDLCRAKIGEFVIPDVRLAAIGGGADNGLLIVPAVGSIILVADVSCGSLRELNAVGYSEIESIRFHQGDTTVRAVAGGIDATVGSSTIHIENGKIRLGGQDNGGLVKIEELRRSLESLKTYCQTMREAVSAGIKAVGAGTSANGATGAETFDSAMSSVAVKIEDMENPKVVH